MKKIFPLFLVVLSAFCSCDDNIHYLSKSERPRFHNGDTFYYYSEQTHLTDTFVVEDMQYSFEHIDDDEFECVTYCFSRINKSSHCDMVFYYDEQNIMCTVGDSIGLIHYDPFYEGFKNEYLFKDTIETEDNNTKYNEPLPTKIYHSHINGFIGYEYSGAIKYDIINPVK